jgi:hypothetical protein
LEFNDSDDANSNGESDDENEASDCKSGSETSAEEE